jgi:hypothetical protein
MSLLIDVIKKAKGKSIEKVMPIVRQKRLEVCNKCDELLKTGNCKKCGCFVSDKTKYKGERCPLNKW